MKGDESTWELIEGQSQTTARVELSLILMKIWAGSTRVAESVGLATKIPKNGLKDFREFLQKCSKNLRFYL